MVISIKELLLDALASLEVLVEVNHLLFLKRNRALLALSILAYVVNVRVNHGWDAATSR